MREVKLPSGAHLKIGPASFKDAKALYQALLREMKNLNSGAKTDILMLCKEVLCTAYSSPEIEACLWECFKKCIYCGPSGDLKIDDSTFEPVKAREDYITVCMEVAKENVAPFMKSLYAECHQLIAMIGNIPA